MCEYEGKQNMIQK